MSLLENELKKSKELALSLDKKRIQYGRYITHYIPYSNTQSDENTSRSFTVIKETGQGVKQSKMAMFIRKEDAPKLDIYAIYSESSSAYTFAYSVYTKLIRKKYLTRNLENDIGSISPSVIIHFLKMCHVTSLNNKVSLRSFLSFLSKSIFNRPSTACAVWSLILIIRRNKDATLDKLVCGDLKVSANTLLKYYLYCTEMYKYFASVKSIPEPKLTVDAERKVLAEKIFKTYM